MTDFKRGLVARDKDGLPIADIRIDAAYGELFIDDGTGFVSGSDPTAEKIDATPVKVGKLNSVTADASERAATTSGQLTIVRAGAYEVYACGSMILSGDADTGQIEVFVNGAVVADAAADPGGSIQTAGVASAASANIPFGLRAIVNLQVGDTVDWRVTGTGTTTVTIKKGRFGVIQVSDVAVPTFSA